LEGREKYLLATRRRALSQRCYSGVWLVVGEALLVAGMIRHYFSNIQMRRNNQLTQKEKFKKNFNKK
jgi:hypothetical protein